MDNSNMSIASSDGLLNSRKLSLDLYFGLISHLFSSKNHLKERNKQTNPKKVTKLQAHNKTSRYYCN